MQLLDRTGFVADPYLRVEAGEIPKDALVLIPLERAGEALGLNIAAPGIEIAVSTSFEAIEKYLARISLVSIAIGGFADGRCFSLARRIRRSGFAGAIRITGPLIADQFPYALACGVDQIQLPEASAVRQPSAQWIAAAAQISATYQRGYERGGNILEQRRAARKAANHG